MGELIFTGFINKKGMQIFITAVLIFIFIGRLTADDSKILEITDSPTTLTYPSFWHTPFGVHRGTPFWLKVFLGNRTYFNNPQDIACTKLLKDYGNIRKGKDDWQLTAYGVNSGNSEIIYNPSMYSLDVFGKEGNGNGEFNHPIGIGCNEYGDIYVADTGNNRLSRWFNDSKKIRFIRNIGCFGSGKGEFNSPTYVELDSKGRVYVSDTGNDRIEVFGKSGGYLYEIGKDKGVLKPRGIFVCDSGMRYSGYRKNYIYFVDNDFNRVQKYDFNGKKAVSVRVDKMLNKKVKLTTLDMDYYGNIYVVDNLNSKLYKFSHDLVFITAYGRFGKDDYEFEHPEGIAIYRHFGQVLVSDRESAQYFWIGCDAKRFEAEMSGNREIKFDFFLTEKGYASLEIEAGGEKNIPVCRRIELEMGENTVLWDIPDRYMDSVLKKGGAYKAVLRVMSTYSSYPNIEKIVKTMVFVE